MITVSLQEKPQIAEAEARPQTQTQPQAAPAGWALRIHQIEMKATTNAAPTPRSCSSWQDEDKLQGEELKKVTTANGILQFCQKYRSDIQYAVKELCPGMNQLTEGDKKRMKKLCRYLLGKPRLVQR